MKEDYKVNPLSIKVDQRKKDTRRDAWDRDYMPADWKKPEPTTTRKISSKRKVFTKRLCNISRRWYCG